MAILFDDASSEYLHNDSAVGGVLPFSVSCWFNVDSLAANSVLYWVGDPSTETAQHQLNTNTSGTLKCSSRGGGSAAVAETSTTMSVDVWNHAGAVWTSITSRDVYLNGGGKGSSTASRDPSPISATDIGRNGDLNPEAYVSGAIAEVGVWNVALTEAEFAVLAKGVSPLLIRPNSLIAYYPLHSLRDLTSRVRQPNILTPFNSPVTADHPPMLYMPSGAAAFGSAVAQGPTNKYIAGGAVFGDSGSTNYKFIGPDGQIMMVGDATYTAQSAAITDNDIFSYIGLGQTSHILGGIPAPDGSIDLGEKSFFLHNWFSLSYGGTVHEVSLPVSFDHTFVPSVAAVFEVNTTDGSQYDFVPSVQSLFEVNLLADSQFSDTLNVAVSIETTLSDGITVTDTESVLSIFETIMPVDVSVDYTPAVEAIFETTLTENTQISDTKSVQMAFEVNIAPGVTHNYVSSVEVAIETSMPVGVSVGATHGVLSTFEVSHPVNVTVSDDQGVVAIYEVNISPSVQHDQSLSGLLDTIDVSMSSGISTGATMSVAGVYETALVTNTQFSDTQSVSANFEVTTNFATQMGEGDSRAVDYFGGFGIDTTNDVTFSVQADYFPNISEATQFSDIQTVNAIFEVTLPEGMTITDIDDVQALFEVNLADGVTLLDTLSGVSFSSFVTPDDRMHTAGAEIRIISVQAEGRLCTVSAEIRTFSAKSD